MGCASSGQEAGCGTCGILEFPMKQRNYVARYPNPGGVWPWALTLVMLNPSWAPTNAWIAMQLCYHRCSFRWSSYSCMAPGCLWIFLKFHGCSWIFGTFHLRCVWVRTESEVQRGCWCLQNCNFWGLTIRIPGVKLQIFGASLNMLYVYKLN